MTDRELMQMALDALEKADIYDEYRKLLEALRARLSQCDRCGEVNPAEIHTCTPKQEPKPVAWMEFEKYMDEDGLMSERKVLHTWDNGKGEPLYTAPPQREWQGLTEYEVGFLTVFDGLHDVEVPLLANFIRHIEAKLKEKNT